MINTRVINIGDFSGYTTQITMSKKYVNHLYNTIMRDYSNKDNPDYLFNKDQKLLNMILRDLYKTYINNMLYDMCHHGTLHLNMDNRIDISIFHNAARDDYKSFILDDTNILNFKSERNLINLSFDKDTLVERIIPMSIYAIDLISIDDGITSYRLIDGFNPSTTYKKLLERNNPIEDILTELWYYYGYTLDKCVELNVVGGCTLCHLL